MGRKPRRPAADTQHDLATCHTHCWTCGASMWVAYTEELLALRLADHQRLSALL